MFQLERRLILSVYPRTEPVKDANVPLDGPAACEFSVGHVVPSREDVDAFMVQAQAADATLTDQAHARPWGIYSGYFKDPDGHFWEVISNP